jgi:secreted trypsin-like serine protease
MRNRLCIALAAVATCAAAAPAGAVIGGEPLDGQDVPWFASVSGCGGTLVAPDRLLTAAHCVGGIAPGDMPQTVVNGETRTVARVAMHPGFRHSNGDNYLDDVAIVQLDKPVTSVAPVTLGDSRENARIVGFGNIFAPGTGHSEADMLRGGLHAATLRQVSDADCARVYETNTPGTGEHFNAARMRCAVDVDGRQPLSSGCFGDSGGALIVGTNQAPVQLGVVSWGGDRCGADHSPSVFADTLRYRGFILDPAPTWGPTQRSAVTIKRSKALRCSVATREPGTKISYVWKHRGHRRQCFAYASNDGGEILVGTATVTVGT